MRELLRVGLPGVIPTKNRSMFWKDIAQRSKSYAVLEVQYFEVLGYLPFRRENRKFQLDDQMVRAIPFGKLLKIWALICDAIFLLF